MSARETNKKLHFAANNKEREITMGFPTNTNIHSNNSIVTERFVDNGEFSQQQKEAKMSAQKEIKVGKKGPKTILEQLAACKNEVSPTCLFGWFNAMNNKDLLSIRKVIVQHINCPVEVFDRVLTIRDREERMILLSCMAQANKIRQSEFLTNNENDEVRSVFWGTAELKTLKKLLSASEVLDLSCISTLVQNPSALTVEAKEFREDVLLQIEDQVANDHSHLAAFVGSITNPAMQVVSQGSQIGSDFVADLFKLASFLLFTVQPKGLVLTVKQEEKTEVAQSEASQDTSSAPQEPETSNSEVVESEATSQESTQDPQ